MRRWGIAVVRGRSMEPTLRDGDRLLVEYGAAPQPGRVAIVRLPERPGWSVKRIGWPEAGGWWVERENPAEGVDSWQVGALRPQDVVAVAWLRAWPKPRVLAGGQRRRAAGRPWSRSARRSRNAR